MMNLEIIQKSVAVFADGFIINRHSFIGKSMHGIQRRSCQNTHAIIIIDRDLVSGRIIGIAKMQRPSLLT